MLIRKLLGTPKQISGIALGATLVLIHTMAVSSGAVCARLALMHVHLAEYFCMTAWIAVAAISPWAISQGWHSLYSQRWAMLFLRGVCLMLALGSFLASIAYLGLGQATLLKQTAPLYVPLLSTIMLKQPLRLMPLSSSLLGFIGVIIILHPKAGALNLGWLLGAESGALIGCAMVQASLFANTDPAKRVSFFSLLTIAIVLTPLAWLSWSAPSFSTLMLMVAGGVLWAIDAAALTAAFYFAAPRVLAPFSYFAVVFAYIWGAIIFEEHLEWYLLAGGLLIAVSCICSCRADKDGAKPL